MVVTVSHAGYIKRVPLVDLPGPARGGKGRSGMSTKDEDFVTRLFVANTHTPGAVLLVARHRLQGKGLAPAAGSAAGKRQGSDQHAAARSRASASPRSCRCPRTRSSWDKLDVMFATTRGTVRRNKLSDFVQVNRNGKIAMKLDEGRRTSSTCRSAPSMTTCC
jgi:DNA gyrase subunit A